MNVLKTTKMNSKILMVLLLAYLSVNLSTARPQLKSLDLNNTPAQSKKTLAPNQPIKINHLPSALGNSKVNSGVPYKISAQPAPPAVTLAPPAPPAVTSALPAPRTPPSALPSIKNTLPPSKASASTTVPTNENDNHQGSESYEDIEEEEEEIEDEDHEEPLENSKTVTSQPMPSSSTSKPTVPESVNPKNDNHQGSESYEDIEEEEEEIEGEDHEEPLENGKTVTSQPMPSSSTSKPTVPESVNPKNDNHQGSESYEDIEEEEEEIEDEDHEEPLENGKTVTSQPMPSSSTSKPTVPESVNPKNDNHQGSESYEDIEEEEEEIEDEDHEEPLENGKTVTSQPMPSSSTSKPTVPESVNPKYDNHQEIKTLEDDEEVVEGEVEEEEIEDGFNTLDGEDDEEVAEENEYGHNMEEYSKDPNHKTPTDYIMINGVQVNPPVPMNNLISTVPQLSEDALTENNYKKSEYPFNTYEDHQAFDEREPEFSNFNNISTETSETPNRKNVNTKDQSINSDEFEISDNTQIFNDKQEETKGDQFNNQYMTENKERIINGYKAMKKILNMLHDYACSTFNWIINKIDYRIEQVSS